MRLTRRTLLGATTGALLGGFSLSAGRSEAATVSEAGRPSRAYVSGSKGSFLYVLNGQPTPLRGMGYNRVLGNLNVAERTARLHRDLSLMQQVGINIVNGWEQGGIEDQYFDIAHFYGIGVIAHFELKKHLDYADAGLREELLGQIAAWIETYRDHPAIRMWGIGNEVMLVKTDEESQAFVDFFVQAFQVARATDPDHPVTYRDAEDVRVPMLRDAFQAAGIPLNGFVMGLNFYTPRMDDVLAQWENQNFDVPVIVSEYAPAGVAPSSRATAMRDLVAHLRPYERLVLGGFPYTWSTDGPEAVDKIFGLTDQNSVPVDETIRELQGMYRGFSGLRPSLPPVQTKRRDVFGVPLDAVLVQALARGLATPDLAPIDVEATRARMAERYQSMLADAFAGRGVDQRRAQRMIQLVVSTAVLAELRRQDETRVFPGTYEALPLLVGMARWSATDPRAESIAVDFLTDVLAQAIRT